MPVLSLIIYAVSVPIVAGLINRFSGDSYETDGAEAFTLAVVWPFLLVLAPLMGLYWLTVNLGRRK